VKIISFFEDYSIYCHSLLGFLLSFCSEGIKQIDQQEVIDLEHEEVENS